MKKWILFSGAALLAAAGAGWFFGFGRQAEREFETHALTRGSIVRSITSTGSLNPVGAVEVGTQVSAIIDKVFADFNDDVKKNQVLVELDRTFLFSALEEARASLSRSEALYAQAEAEYKRNQPLLEKGFLSDQEFTRIRTDYLTQKAALQSAKASVNKATTNLGYATIRSPISGKVIQRNVEPGQTVSASLSAPTLFIIAEDLDDMEILAKVDEGDIGRIHKDQEVRFTVQAYPDRTFDGRVIQIRLQPEEIQNVVTYTVIVRTQNPDGTLLPGMTATVDFIEERLDDALLLPAVALRFQPPEDLQALAEKQKQAGRMSRSSRDGDGSGDKEKKGDGKGDENKNNTGESKKGWQSGGKRGRSNRGEVWILGETGAPEFVTVRLGASDGVNTEILSSRSSELGEGAEVIVGFKKADEKQKKQISLLPQRRRRNR